MRYSSGCATDTRIEIKEGPLSDTTSQYEKELLPKDIAVKTNRDITLLLDNRDMALKSEIKSEVTFPDFCSQKEREFHPEDHEMYNKIEIKEEKCWLETETSTVCDDKDEGFPPVKSPRLCTDAVSGISSGESPLPTAEDSGKDRFFFIGKDCSECASAESDITKIHHGKRPHRCSICKKSYTHVSHLKRHVSNGCEILLKCDICEKSFTRLSGLKMHNLIHEGKKPFKCDICEKRFTKMSGLKTHKLIHSGERPHKCKACDKSFTQLSQLKFHILIHEGKKPHKCEICEKRFTRLSSLKSHNLIHEGTKPYKCEICEKSFSKMQYMKAHKLIHGDQGPYNCKACEKRFTQMSDLKKHNFFHQQHKGIQM